MGRVRMMKEWIKERNNDLDRLCEISSNVVKLERRYHGQGLSSGVDKSN